MRNFMDRYRPVEAIAPATGGSDLTGDYISLKMVNTVNVLIHITQGNAATCDITLEQATAVAGTDSKALTIPVMVRANEDCAASDAIVRQTDAVGFTTDTALKHKIIEFQIDPATLDTNNGFDCLTVKVGASDATNIIQSEYIVSERYKDASVIVD